jgi:TolB-like protein
LLLEFASVVDAVRCAVEIQRAMIEREAGLPEDGCIKFRIGINLGDIIAEGDDIFGDGVNVAARLEAVAERGGICITRVVPDQVRDKLPFAFQDLGEQNLKNITRPVRAYALGAAAVAEFPQVTALTPPKPKRRRARSGRDTPRLSIVVLPFPNLSNDPEQEYFTDGVTENVTTDLSRIAHSFVISRNTAFTYRNKPIDTKQIGRELGVRYVLEGRSNDDIGDLFALQDEITRRIAFALNLELWKAEASRPSQTPGGVDYLFVHAR